MIEVDNPEGPIAEFSQESTFLTFLDLHPVSIRTLRKRNSKKALVEFDIVAGCP